jgi:catechol 2,3-dioxygenase-like lactoylglutathione lyase family enzyme
MTAANDTPTSGQVRVHAIRIVTDDLAPLVAFYDTLLGTSTPAPGPYTEIPTETGVHVSFSRRDALEDVLPPAALDAAVRRGILDVEVNDVDAHVNMLRAVGAIIVDKPSPRPRGARAATVADPDGRIINVFAPARRSP